MTEIYGHKIDLEEADDDELVTDVMVIARVVRYADDGRAEDAILTSLTRNTTGIIQTGMVYFAVDSLAGDEEAS